MSWKVLGYLLQLFMCPRFSLAPGTLQLCRQCWGGWLPAAVEASGAGVAAGVGRALSTHGEALIARPHVLQSEVLIATFQQEVVRKDRFTKG